MFSTIFSRDLYNQSKYSTKSQFIFLLKQLINEHIKPIPSTSSSIHFLSLSTLFYLFTLKKKQNPFTFLYFILILLLRTGKPCPFHAFFFSFFFFSFEGKELGRQQYGAISKPTRSLATIPWGKINFVSLSAFSHDYPPSATWNQLVSLPIHEAKLE